MCVGTMVGAVACGGFTRDWPVAERPLSGRATGWVGCIVRRWGMTGACVVYIAQWGYCSAQIVRWLLWRCLLSRGGDRAGFMDWEAGVRRHSVLRVQG